MESVPPAAKTLFQKGFWNPKNFWAYFLGRDSENVQNTNFPIGMGGRFVLMEKLSYYGACFPLVSSIILF